MSIEPIHSSERSLSDPTDLSPRRAAAEAKPRGSVESEFEQFLEQAKAQPDTADAPSLRAWLELAEAWKITKTLRECRGNRSAAARSLGIGRRTLYAKMEKLQIAPTWAMRGHALDD